ncbi:hypothetical protein Molly5_67 [Maribacter phage Molly_5]|uniref:Uncharacterized protein n=2 Tax=Mollyvirus TaxID=2948826 RepID=A0A8E4XZS4_9CAUD|nr:hypothetical protein M1M29_gp067 [Maribacter phage Molly_1]YP_010357314.1 hypothetical protein M1M30_gp065 [Maribacter phage Colly_1]QQO97752.1 hypothetical protein Molly2_67 [Maribacter phage Molly_2]QQO97952.1 hypothetical protein Molly3_67 [Maribacter phage Molly_3]QQO98152.1 hypothetical protein Molly4_67 [Maribacter phage Molly_4]QQO98352.1 hypothetical protein Molly5_67 [Maribacter phage Molly_5]QQO97350.1 hypothetical protein Colly1_65 [Maribacter phage Colly_1]
MEAEEDNLDLNKIVKYLSGSNSIQDIQESDKLALLLRNYSKAGNAYLAMMVYKTMERVSRMMTALDFLEAKLYSQAELDKMWDPEQMSELIVQINNTMNNGINFIMQMSSKRIENKYKATNFNFNINTFTNVETTDNAKLLDSTQRQNMRDLVEKVKASIMDGSK